MPRPGLPLVNFNDDRCGSVAELRSVILKARRTLPTVAAKKLYAEAVTILDSHQEMDHGR